MSGPTAAGLTVGELAIARHMRDLIVKPLEAHVFGAPMSADPVEFITTGANAELAELPEDWFDLGLMLKGDGITWGREQDRASVEAIGYRDPVRYDIISDQFSMAFSALETNRHTMEMALQQDLSSLLPQAVTGEIAFDQKTEKSPSMRLLTVARDGTGVNTIFVARQFYAAEVTEVGEQVLSDGDNGPLVWPITAGSTVDTVVGVGVRHYFGGPGWRSRLAAAGFPALTP